MYNALKGSILVLVREMNKVYYKEEIVQNTDYREQYIATLDEFLAEEHKRAAKKRDFMNPKKYIKNAEKYRKLFVEFLGFPLNIKNVKPKLVEKKFVSQDGNVNIYRMQFLFFDKIKFYGIWFEQIEDAREKPFVIGLHGGGGTPEMVSSMHLESANYNHLVRRATDRGANVFAPQLYLWEVEKYGNAYDRMKTDAKCRQLGGSITALELRILQGCIDYFLEDGMNESQVGVVGLSYGGLYSLYLAALDDRIKACYSSNWVCDSFTFPMYDWSFLNAEKRFSIAETAGLICPRSLVVSMGDKDFLFPFKETEKECLKIIEYYKEYGCVDQFKLVIFDGDHEFNKKNDEYDFFFSKLKAG